MKRQQALPIEQDSIHSRLRVLRRQIFLSSVAVVLILVFSSEVPGAATVVWFRDIHAAAKSALCAPHTPLTLSPLRCHSRKEYHNAITPFSFQPRPQPLLANIKPRSFLEVHPAVWRVREKSQEQHRWYHQQGQRQRQRQQVQHQRHGASSPLCPDLGSTEAACTNSEVYGVPSQPPATPSPPLFLTFTATVAQTVQTLQRLSSSKHIAVRADTFRLSTGASIDVMRTPSCLCSSNAVPSPSVDRPSDAKVLTVTSNVYTTLPSITQRTVPAQAATERRSHGDMQHPDTTVLREKSTSFSSSIEHTSQHTSPNSEDHADVEEQRISNTSLQIKVDTLAGTAGKKLVSSLPRVSSEKSSGPGRLLVEEAVQEGESVAAEPSLSFPRLGIFPNFVEALRNFGICTATEIQQLCLPAILSGADVILGAETGSGKTLGYLLGILQNVMVQKMIHEQKEDEAMMRKDDLPLPRHYPYAIVVVPTRELALQVAAWSRRLCKKTPITTHLLLGSYTRWPYGTLTLPTSPDIILCTPQVLERFTSGGRCRKRHVSLFEQTHMLVLDEADMLLDGGYKKMMEPVFLEFRKTDKILASTGKRRTQYVFAAATIPDRGPMSIRKTIASLCPEASFLCTDSLHRQKRELQQEFIEIQAHASFTDRTALLLSKLREVPLSERVMIFCNTAHTAKQVVQVLEEKLPLAANPKLFSSDLDQKDRARNLSLFAREKSKVLVCTDAASRGLDIVGVTTVIQFDFALNATVHLHRVGRVARAGRSGKAINFYEPVNKPLVDAVRQAACDPIGKSLADAFSRRRSFRKSLKKSESSSVGLVVDYPSPAMVPERLQEVNMLIHQTEHHAAHDKRDVGSG